MQYLSQYDSPTAPTADLQLVPSGDRLKLMELVQKVGGLSTDITLYMLGSPRSLSQLANERLANKKIKQKLMNIENVDLLYGPFSHIDDARSAVLHHSFDNNVGLQLKKGSTRNGTRSRGFQKIIRCNACESCPFHAVYELCLPTETETNI